YQADITYGTNNEFGFDYLRDNLAFRLEDRVQRGLHYAIVDEVDSILIDEARTPLIISGPAEESTELYLKVNELAPRFSRQAEEEGEGDFFVDEKSRQIHLSETGFEKAETLLQEAGLLAEGDSLYDAGGIRLMHHLNAALRAHHLYNRDVEYIVRNGEVIIVDEFTGRTMPGRRWSDGLHQAVEAKERVKVREENQTIASITFQNFFRLYGKLAGMTGTADTEAFEFQQIYGLEVVVIPTHRPMVRKDQPDLVYLTQHDKFQAILDDIRDCMERKQPVLVGTTSIETSELLSKELDKQGIVHQVLNAKQHEREAQVIAQAGRPGTVTIATNMAGRGTDIVLGGNVEKQVEHVRAEEGLDEAARETRIQTLREEWAQLHQTVVEAGGLHIIGTERHESRRIDNQLRGRSGRQGDPGSSRFYLSLEDTLMRIFGDPERTKSLLKTVGMREGEVIESRMLTRQIERAQRKVESHNFDARKNLLEYDDVANDQRKVIYQQRNEILESQGIVERIAGLRRSALTDVVRQHVPAESVEEQWDLPALEKELKETWRIELPLVSEVEASEAMTDEDVLDKVLAAGDALFQSKLDLVGLEQFAPFMRMVLLQSIDSHWRDHLAALDYLRQGIHLRGYAQKNPKQEYKREAFALFSQLLDVVKTEVSRILLNVQIQTQDQASQAAEAIEQRASQVANVTYTHPNEDGSVSAETDPATAAAAMPRVGRNDPCPCGSGKKYKACHGKLA
ncbi:MAG: preprotein translocase subunit SecA, partial [Steroidobacteraceae bacterium]